MGLAYRVLCRLDVKAPNLVKPYQFEGLRVIGKPAEYAKRYADEGADEILYLDVVASLYGRNQLESLIEETSEEVFVPISVGGGVKSCSDVGRLLKFGADKIALNTNAILRAGLVQELSSSVGSQAIVVSIEAKRTQKGWEAYTDCGRNPSGKDAIKWAETAARLGAGELLITSIDQDGTRKGPDIELLKRIDVDIPVIACGGIRLQDVCEVAQYSDALAIGASFHYGDCTIAQVKDALRRGGKEVR